MTALNEIAAERRIDRADRAIANQFYEFIVGNVAFFILPAAVLLLARWKGGTEEQPMKVARLHGTSFLHVLAFAPFLFGEVLFLLILLEKIQGAVILLTMLGLSHEDQLD